ncbi:MAG: hypothetical protein Q7R70_07110 [Candidatus Diapherotrites archaeon]|nr:hypothetical protein [Candidatus Diapherotrites archaeon]
MAAMQYVECRDSECREWETCGGTYSAAGGIIVEQKRNEIVFLCKFFKKIQRAT